MQVKIKLKKGESLESAQEELVKALSIHSNGDVHEGDSFIDPLMESVHDILIKAHGTQYEKMLKEIMEILDK